MDKLRLFKIASAANEKSLNTFARENNVTPPAIHRVLIGNSRSDRLSLAIDTFIRNGMHQLRIDIRNWGEN